jgi:pyruvate/2-oxoglutarate dehydrogenase complex dihydrolipoamide dehydrogenase (E3) component
MKHFDALIIGSGQGGTPLAKKLAKNGWKTALVEKNKVGGTCVNVGCTPTKTMIASAKTAYTVKGSAKYGILTDGFRVDMNVIHSRTDKVVESFRNGSQNGLEKTENLELIFGLASFTGERKMKVVLSKGGEEEITADKIFIDTGCHPSIPDIEGLNQAGYYTSTSLLKLQQIPGHLLIIGGGYVGLEFGQMYRRFGSRVTILEKNDRLLIKEDEDIAAEVLKFLQEEEIDVLTNAEVIKVEKENGSIVAYIKRNTEERTVQCSHILVSAGRTPNTKDLNLELTGVNVNQRGQIIVNAKLETTAKDIYAIGDVKGGPEFTHIAYNDYIILYNNLLNGKNQSTENRMVPYTMFTDPQLGRIGITEQEARKKGLKIKVANLPMTNVARAIETGDTRGIMKAVVDGDSGEILGAAVVGTEGGEIMSVLQMAMLGGITSEVISDMIFAHPLYAESLNNLFMTLSK